MAINSTQFSPGDTEAVILRKILETLQNAGGGTGPASAVTIANGADVALGSTTDAFQVNPIATATLIAISKGMMSYLNAIDIAEGAKTDAAVTNPASNASVIAALKGLLSLTATNSNVGGFTKTIKDTTAVSTSPAYSIGDAVGAKRTLTGALRTSNGTAILESITLLDRANQKAGMEIIIFDADPTNATITDNAAFVYSTDDLKVLARITLAATDYVTLNSKAIAQLRGLGVALTGANGNTNLYAAVVTTGTPTFAATTDVQVIFGFLQD